MKLLIHVENGGVCASVRDVPSWIESAAQLYDALEELQETEPHPELARFLKLAKRSPGWWQGSTFIALDNC